MGVPAQPDSVPWVLPLFWKPQGLQARAEFVCVCVCVLTCVCMSISEYVCSHARMCICVCAHTCTFMHVYRCMCVCVHAHRCVCARACTCVHVFVYVHVCVCVSAAWEVPQGGIQQGPPLPHSRFFWELPACGTSVQAEPRFVMDPVEEVLSWLEGGGSTSLLGP